MSGGFGAAALRSALAPGGRLARFAAPGAWLWGVLLAGTALRLALLLLSQGSHDVAIWQSHSGWIRQYGLIGYYQRSEVFNHPPFVGQALAELWALAAALGVPFRVLLRLSTSAIDLGSALLLMRLFAGSPARYLVFAACWLNPLAIVFSAHHGNTDPAVAFAALLGVWAASRGRAAAAGAAIGAGLWIKLPVLIAAPALFFALPGWRARLIFGATALGVGVATALPTLVSAPQLVAERVLGYQGMLVSTPDGTPIWGLWNVFGLADALAGGPAAGLHEAHLAANSWVSLLPGVALAALRRRERTARGIGATVCGSFLLFHGLTQLWAFQYLAWMIPFWVFAGPLFYALATLTATGYVYAVYAMLCGDPFLLGRWAFQAHPAWPPAVLFLRDASLLVCAGGGFAFLGAAAAREWRRLRSRAA